MVETVVFDKAKKTRASCTKRVNYNILQNLP